MKNKEHYERLRAGHDVVESRLRGSLPEHLNSEIVAGTIANMDQARRPAGRRPRRGRGRGASLRLCSCALHVGIRRHQPGAGGMSAPPAACRRRRR